MKIVKTMYRSHVSDANLSVLLIAALSNLFPEVTNFIDEMQ
jgi:hypothetical protein